MHLAFDRLFAAPVFPNPARPSWLLVGESVPNSAPTQIYVDIEKYDGVKIDCAQDCLFVNVNACLGAFIMFTALLGGMRRSFDIHDDGSRVSPRERDVDADERRLTSLCKELASYDPIGFVEGGYWNLEFESAFAEFALDVDEVLAPVFRKLSKSRKQR